MDSGLENSHSTEMFALEGPRVSDEVNDFGEIGHALTTPTAWKHKDREIRITDTITVNSQRFPLETPIPAVTRHVIRREWNEENGTKIG